MRRGALREALEDARLDPGMIGADRAAREDGERGEPDQAPAAVGEAAQGEREQGEGERRRNGRNAATSTSRREEAAPDIRSRRRRRAGRPGRRWRGRGPCRGWSCLVAPAQAGAPGRHGSRRDASLRWHDGSPSALAGRPRPARGGRRRVAAEPGDGLQRVMELEVLDALGLQLLGGGGEARIGLAVVLDRRRCRPSTSLIRWRLRSASRSFGRDL